MTQEFLIPFLPFPPFSGLHQFLLVSVMFIRRSVSVFTALALCYSSDRCSSMRAILCLIPSLILAAAQKPSFRCTIDGQEVPASYCQGLAKWEEVAEAPAPNKISVLSGSGRSATATWEVVERPACPASW
jgi:hypothetical protein